MKQTKKGTNLIFLSYYCFLTQSFEVSDKANTKAIFFVIFSFNFKIICSWKTYFINYKLQTNKKEKKLPTTYFTRPSGYWKSTPFAYSICLYLQSSPPPPNSKAKSDKVSNSFGLQNFFKLLPFSLVYSMLFSLFHEIFSAIFFTSWFL